MKRIAIVSLVVVFLTVQFAYATCPLEEFSKRIKTSQYQEMTQDEVEELFVAFLSSIDWETLDWEVLVEQVIETHDNGSYLLLCNIFVSLTVYLILVLGPFVFPFFIVAVIFCTLAETE